MVITIAAVAMAATVAYRELSPPRLVGGLQTDAPPTFEPEWRSILRNARNTGDSLAPVQLVEFSDLECPACRQFHERTLPALREKFGSAVAVSFVHLPLRRIHRFADQAAHAAECAADQGRFAAFIERAYGLQDSIGLKPWWAIARESGARDSASFAKCMYAGRRAALVDSGLAIAERLDIHETPTVIINGWRYVHAPSRTRMEEIVGRVLKGLPVETGLAASQR